MTEIAGKSAIMPREDWIAAQQGLKEVFAIFKEDKNLSKLKEVQDVATIEGE